MKQIRVVFVLNVKDVKGNVKGNVKDVFNVCH
jgi:hypothetical protein